MATLLCVTTGLSGILQASLELGRRLEQAGHEVHHACPADRQSPVRGIVGGLATHFHELPPLNLQPAPLIISPGSWGNRLVGKAREVITRNARRQAGIEALGVDSFAALLDALRPDLLLLDMELHEYILLASSRRQRLVLLSPFFDFWKRPGLPPLQSGELPGDEAAVQQAWSTVHRQARQRHGKNYLRYLGTDRRGVLQAYSRSLGHPAGFLDQLDWVTIFTYPDLPHWSLTASELDFPHEAPPNLHYIGPFVLAQRPDPRFSQREQARFQGVCGEARAAGQYLVHASLSTMPTPEANRSQQAWLQTLMEAFRRRPRWSLVLSLAGQPGLDCESPANVHTFEWLAQVAALGQVDATIQHGGVHGLHEAILGRVPLLMRSAGRFDQDGNCARMGYHGLGQVLPHESLEVDSLLHALETLRGQAGLAGRLDKVATQLERYRDQAVLEQAVENQLDQAQ